MKNLTHFPAIAVVSLLLTLSGCASSGSSTEGTGTTTDTTEDTGINTDTLRVAVGETAPADTVTKAPEDSVSTPVGTDTPTTITGSTVADDPWQVWASVIEVNGDASMKLDDYLRTVAGVRVLGNREHAEIIIRGETSLGKMWGACCGAPGAREGSTKTSPLFFIDGVRFGRDFREVYFYINMSMVKDIQIIKGPEAAYYGSEGSNGVILINHFTPDDLIQGLNRNRD